MAYGLRNNATSKLTAGIGTASTSVSITVGEGQLFINNSVATLESRNSDGDVVKREVVLISNISGDTLTIERAYGPCVVDDTAEDKEMQSVAQSFSAGDTLSIYLASEVIQDLYTPAQQVVSLCTCICNCHDTRMQQAKQKMIDCYGDISYGTGCDGDCVISGCVFLCASKEYEFRNLTICSGACVRFVGSGVPKIHVMGTFINNGAIDLRGGCPVGTYSFTNCFGSVSNNYCATCYNAQCYGCGGKGGVAPYTTSTNGPYGGDGGNANISGGTGIGGCGICCSTYDINCVNGCNGNNGGLGCGGGGGGASASLTSFGYISLSSATPNGCNGNGYDGGNGGCVPQINSTYSCLKTAGGGGGGGGGYRTGKGGNGGYGATCYCSCYRCGTKVGGAKGGDGGNGGIRGTGGSGGSGYVRIPEASYYGSNGCCCNCGGFGGKGGNGFCGGDGGIGYYSCFINGTGGRTCGGNGGNGVCKGGSGGSVYFCPCSTSNPISQACAGKGGDAINNMYGLVVRAKLYCNNGYIRGAGGTGGNGGSVYCNGALLTSGTNIKGGNGGRGGNGANIMIFYCCNLRTTDGYVYYSGGSGGSGGTGATCGTAGTNGTSGTYKFCQRNV